MTCKEIEKMIPLFLKDDLDTDDLRDFLEHINSCEECREELTIQFLVLVGMERLEAGSVFDLQTELKLRMEEAEHALKRRKRMKYFLFLSDGLVMAALIILIVLLIVL